MLCVSLSLSFLDLTEKNKHFPYHLVPLTGSVLTMAFLTVLVRFVSASSSFSSFWLFCPDTLKKADSFLPRTPKHWSC